MLCVYQNDGVHDLYHHLNNFDPHIKFSIELESNSGTLPFLDCMTHKNGHKLKTTIYQKPTDLGVTLADSSAHPKLVYASIVSSMFRRARTLCTEEVDRVAAQIEVKNWKNLFTHPICSKNN